MSEFIHDLMRNPQTPLATLSVALPFPLRSQSSLLQNFEGLFRRAPLYGATWMNNLCHQLPGTVHPDAESIVLRGAARGEKDMRECKDLLDAAMEAYNCYRLW